MNETTFLLAILVKKQVLTPAEAKALRKSLDESVTNANLKEMATKVDKALEVTKSETPTLDARELLK